MAPTYLETYLAAVRDWIHANFCQSGRHSNVNQKDFMDLTQVMIFRWYVCTSVTSTGDRFTKCDINDLLLIWWNQCDHHVQIILNEKGSGEDRKYCWLLVNENMTYSPCICLAARSSSPYIDGDGVVIYYTSAANKGVNDVSIYEQLIVLVNKGHTHISYSSNIIFIIFISCLHICHIMPCILYMPSCCGENSWWYCVSGVGLE